MFSNRKIVLLILLVVTATIGAYWIVVVIPTRLAEKTYEGAKQIGRDFAKVFSFTPEVTVNNTVVLLQQSPVLELATLSQKFEHHYDWTNTWLGSTKKIGIKGGFEAKVGFDLRKKFSIQINDDKAIVYLPPPQLLSIQPLDNVTFTDESGVWNWVSMEDRSKAMNAFTADARKYAAGAGFTDAARESMVKQLTEILASHGKTVEVRYEEGPILRPM
ncbi:DUF4230 domain-containing protein [Chryseolinea sp. T2]|uniref:DUF4230 domain-containing protein n=1 Tax=Chryseolinea sp. T2 TaxID=3129255 RepID=UPI00307891BD